MLCVNILVQSLNVLLLLRECTPSGDMINKIHNRIININNRLKVFR